MTGNYYDGGYDHGIGFWTPLKRKTKNLASDAWDETKNFASDLKRKAGNVASDAWDETKKYAKEYGTEALIIAGGTTLAPFTGGTSLAIAGNALIGAAAGAAAGKVIEGSTNVAERQAKRAYRAATRDDNKSATAPLILGEQPSRTGPPLALLNNRLLNAGMLRKPTVLTKPIAPLRIEKVFTPAVNQSQAAQVAEVATAPTASTVAKKDNTALYVGLGVVGIAAAAYFISKKK